MKSVTQTYPISRAREIVARVKISDVYRALASREPRQTGANTWRATAVWREGIGLNVSMDDGRGVWRDFATAEGGGVLALVARVRGGSHHEALKWLADFAGIPLNDKPLSAAQRAKWALDRRRIEQELPRARSWRRAAIMLCEHVLDSLKAGFVDPQAEPVRSTELRQWTRQLEQFKRIDGGELVDEFRWWMEHDRKLTAGMVHAAQTREAAERRALLAYLKMTSPEVHQV